MRDLQWKIGIQIKTLYQAFPLFKLILSFFLSTETSTCNSCFLDFMNEWRLTFLAINISCSPNSACKRGVRPISEELKILLFVCFYLNRICGFHFWCVLIESFCNDAFAVSGSCLNFVWLSKIRKFSENNFHTSDAYI